MRSWRDESGQVLVITALCMLVLLGMLGMALDVGWLFRAKRNTQIAADAAAVAAALDYKYNGSTISVATQGQAAAAQNGVTDGVNGAVVTINIPPVDGPNADSPGFVEAIVQDPTPTMFMAIFGLKSVDIAARAVVGTGSGAGCFYTLARSGKDISLTGSGQLTARNCNIYDNSSASDAMKLTGSGSITAKSIGITGGYSNVGSGSIQPNPITGMAPAVDPLSDLAVPNIPTGTCSGGTYTNNGSTNVDLSSVESANGTTYCTVISTGSGSVNMGAGNYTIDGNFSSTGSSSITMGSGLYEVGGNLQLTGSGPLTGNGVTFYTQGSTTVTGSSNLTLTAPTSGMYSGVLLFQSRSDSSAVSITGSSGSTTQEIVYAPDSPLTLTGSGTMTVSLDVIVDSFSETGSGGIIVTNYAVLTNSNSVLGKMVMVE